MASEIRGNRSDKLGIFSAVLCVAHCTLLPVAFALVTNLDNPFFGFSHLVDFLFVVISLASVYFSSKHSPSNLVKSALWFFVFIFISGVYLEHISAYGKAIALFGSTGLIIAHFFNLRLCRKKHSLSFNN